MEQDNQKHNKAVETYALDMERIIENDTGGGLIKKIIEGEEENEKEKRRSSPEAKKNKFFMFLGFVLMLTGLVALFYLISVKKVPTVPVEKQFVPLIFNDKSVFVEVKDFNKEEIIQTIFNAASTALVKQGGVEGIYPTFNKKMIGLRQFLSLIKISFVPGSEIFLSDNFLMGIVNTEVGSSSLAGRDFFILLKVRSTADVFDSLRAWETKMFLDLHGFFGKDITPETKQYLTQEFQNYIVENKNARVLFDEEKNIVMMYVFVDDNSIVITDSENAAHEIILRLAASQIKK